jgi:glutamine synthetase
MTPQEVLEYAKKNGLKQLDLRFCDIPGLQHHVSYPITELSEDPGLGRNQRKRHAADTGSEYQVHRSLL